MGDNQGATATRLEAIASMLEALASRWEAIASRLGAWGIGLEYFLDSCGRCMCFKGRPNRAE